MTDRLRIPTTVHYQQNSTDTRLQGRWLLVARIIWMVIAILILILFLASLPAAFAVLQTVCSGNACEFGAQLTNQLAPSDVQWLQGHGLSLTFFAVCFTVLIVMTTVIWYLVGIIIFWRRSDDWMALLVAFWLVTFGGAFINNYPLAILATQLVNPGWEVLTQSLVVLGFLSFASYLFLFPDGNLLKRHMRWFFICWITVNGCLFYYFNYISFPDSFVLVYLSLFIIIGVIYQIYHYRRLQNSEQRQQSKWVIFSLFIALPAIAVTFLLPFFFPVLNQSTLYTLISFAAIYLFADLMPLSIGIAIFRSQLFNIDIIITRTLVYGLLTISIVAVYILLVGVLTNAFQGFVPHGDLLLLMLGTGLIALLVHPLRNMLQRVANRLMFGEAGDPYAVLSHLGKRLGMTLTPDQVFPALVETVAHSLKLPYVAITLRQGEEFNTLASYGSFGKNVMHLPLIYQAEKIGELVLSRRASGESFNKRELHLLNELARQAGVAMQTVLLTADLERSRHHIVESREKARRQLGNDLHDSLAPTFTAFLHRVEMISTALEHDPVVVHHYLEEIRQQVKETNHRIRQLAYQLHPPELELYGLVQALREQVQGYDQPHPDALHVTIEAPQEPLSLSIAVESAAYYIASAALNNATRHARAHTCLLRLIFIHDAESVRPIPGVWNTAVLELEVSDDGCGLPPREQRNAPGLGLISMQERAAELGGTCVIETRVTGGTRVYARFPCIPIAHQHGIIDLGEVT